MRFRRIRVDAKRNRNKMLADTNESGYVWTEPKLSAKAFKFKQYVTSMLLVSLGHPVQTIQLTSNSQPKNCLITICLYKSKVHGA